MHLKSLLSWYLGGAIAAIAVGWLAAQVHASGHAPIGLTSLGVGALLGALLIALAATVGIVGGRQLALSAVLFAGITIAAEHAWLYRDFRGQWQEARKSPAVAIFRSEAFHAEKPPSPREYFEHEFNGPLWSLDAAFIAITAVGTVIVLQRLRR
jgi:hypothetical protein